MVAAAMNQPKYPIGESTSSLCVTVGSPPASR